MNVFTKLKLTALSYYGKKPLVLNLELSHDCNLKCKYCGRVRDGIKGKVSYEDAVKAIDEVDAPIVYFTGGEPFLYVEDLTNLANYALDKGKVVIVVTNGTLVSSNIKKLRIKNKENFILMFSIDGMQETQDKIKGKDAFKKLEKGIQMAKLFNFKHKWANFTIYSSNYDELEDVVFHFTNLIEYFHLNMYFDFLGNASSFDINEIADRALKLKKERKVFNPHLYFHIWKGLKLDCTPWGTVTLDPKGWRSPCYFVENNHFSSYKDLMEKTNWKKYSKKKDPKCKNCYAHCGFEPTIYRKKSLLLKEIKELLSSRRP